LRKITKIIEGRKKCTLRITSLTGQWGELLAYGTLLAEGYDVRLSGQDVESGTFLTGHAVLKLKKVKKKSYFTIIFKKTRGFLFTILCYQNMAL
jgi:2-oxoglutarate dehydrogenase E1 component